MAQDLTRGGDPAEGREAAATASAARTSDDSAAGTSVEAMASAQSEAARSVAAHSVPEIEGQLDKLWARAAAARADQARARIALTAAQAEAAARAAAALAAADDPGDAHLVSARSSVLNLVVIAGHRETADYCSSIIADTAGRHPSRSLIISAVDPEGPPGLQARIEALTLSTAGGRAETGAETIHVTASGETGQHLASIIVPLLVHDLPVAVWWPHDPQFRSRRADRLLTFADRLIVDGSSWSGDGLDRLAEIATVASAGALVVADFALLRQARWREAIASVYDLPDLRAHLRSVRSIVVEFAAEREGDPAGTTNIVRPVYHVAWLASRLGMTVSAPLRSRSNGIRTATLRQGGHDVAVEFRPAISDLGAGSTVRIELESRVRGAELVGQIEAGDLTVDVTVRDKGRERVKRTYLAPRLNDVDLICRAVEDSAADPVAVGALAMAGRIIAGDAAPGTASHRRRRDADV